MSLYARKRVLLAKVEATYGADATPTGKDNAILVRNLSIEPQQADFVDRELVRPTLGHSEQIPVGIHATCEFEVEMAASGKKGTAPAYGLLLQACGMKETVDAGKSVTYQPISTKFSSLTLHFFVDGVLHALTGARGSVSIGLTVNEIPRLSFNFMGLYQAVKDTALPTITTTAWKKPLPVTSTNTTALSLHGFASGVMQELSIDLANDVIYRSLVGSSESVQITDRAPTGSITIEAVKVAEKDWWKSVQEVTTGALSVTHGTVEGAKIKIDAPSVQLLSPQYSDQDGIQMLQMGLRLVPGAAGDDELKITAL